jgi:hypothetical protein
MGQCVEKNIEILTDHARCEQKRKRQLMRLLLSQTISEHQSLVKKDLWLLAKKII